VRSSSRVVGTVRAPGPAPLGRHVLGVGEKQLGRITLPSLLLRENRRLKGFATGWRTEGGCDDGGQDGARGRS